MQISVIIESNHKPNIAKSTTKPCPEALHLNDLEVSPG